MGRLFVIASAMAVIATTGAAAAEDDSAKTCISSWGEARFGGVGFNHLVHVANRCTASATCAVSTDVEPAPQTVTVPGKETVEVVTHVGSPASQFTPRVSCVMNR
jgi:hypothetical protein